MRARAFTLIEVLVVVLIVGLLLALLLVGVRAAARAAQGVADTQTAAALQTAIEQFKQDNGFLPPMAYDGDPLEVDPPAVIDDGIGSAYLWISNPVQPNSAPVIETVLGTRFVAVYNKRRDIDFFRGGEDAGGNDVRVGNLAPGASGFMSDARYSKFSLPIYLSGVQDRDVDGRNGPGMAKPLADGTFAGVAGEGSVRPIDAYIQPTGDLLQVDSSYIDNAEAREHTGNADAEARADRPFAQAFVDRYGRAFRYYRWEHGRNTVDAADPSEVGVNFEAADLNIPYVLQDMRLVRDQLGDRSVDATGGNVQLRSASYAIVGAGQDGYFGTERLEDMDPANTPMTDEEVANQRWQAQEDNIVAVGR